MNKEKEKGKSKQVPYSKDRIMVKDTGSSEKLVNSKSTKQSGGFIKQDDKRDRELKGRQDNSTGTKDGVRHTRDLTWRSSEATDFGRKSNIESKETKDNYSPEEEAEDILLIQNVMSNPNTKWIPLEEVRKQLDKKHGIKRIGYIS